MLLPVTIVPRTVGAVGAGIVSGGSAAVSGIAMLNPVRWIGVNGATKAGNETSVDGEKEGYKNARDMKGAVVEKDTVVFSNVDEDNDSTGES